MASQPTANLLSFIGKIDWNSTSDFQLVQPEPPSICLRLTKGRLQRAMSDEDWDGGVATRGGAPSRRPRRPRQQQPSMRRDRAQRLAARRAVKQQKPVAAKRRRRAEGGFVVDSDSNDDGSGSDSEEGSGDEDDTDTETEDEDDTDVPSPRVKYPRARSARNWDFRTGAPSLRRVEQAAAISPIGNSPIGNSPGQTRTGDDEDGMLDASREILLDRLRVLHGVIEQQNTTIHDQQDRLDAFELIEATGGVGGDDDDEDYCAGAGAGAGKQKQESVDQDLLQKVPASVLAARFRRSWDQVFSSGAKDLEALTAVGVSPTVAASIQEFARSLALRARVMTCRTILRTLGFSADSINGVVSAMAKLGARAPSADCANVVSGILLTGPPGTGKTFLMDTISAYVKRECGLLIPDVLAVEPGKMRAKYSGVAEQDIWATFEAANTTTVPVTWSAVVDFLVSMGMSREDLEARALRSAKAAAAKAEKKTEGALDDTVDLPASIGIVLIDECQAILSKASEARDTGTCTTANAIMGRPLSSSDTLVIVLGATNDPEEVHLASLSRLKPIAVPRPDDAAAAIVMTSVLTNTIDGFDGYPSPKAEAAVMAAVASAGNDIRTMRTIAMEVGSRRMATSGGVVLGNSFLSACLSRLQFEEAGSIDVPEPSMPPALTEGSITLLPDEADYISVATRVAGEIRGVTEYALDKLGVAVEAPSPPSLLLFEEEEEE